MRYTPKNILGIGGHAKVYLGYDEIKQQYVAIKILSNSICCLQREIDILTYISQKDTTGQLLKLYDVYTNKHETWIITEYLADFKNCIDITSKYDYNTWITISLNLTKHLKILKDLGIVHLDIKPDNIMINPITYEAKLIDYGFARLMNGQVSRRTGTLGYADPCIIKGIQPAQLYLSDVYSLGATLYELFERVPLIDYEDLQACRENKRRPFSNNIFIKQDLKDMIWKMTDSFAYARPSLDMLIECLENQREKHDIVLDDITLYDITE